MEELDLNKFDPRLINKKRKAGHSPIMAFLGSRGRGKSTLVGDILYFIQDIPFVMVMSGTEEANGHFSKIVHPLFVYSKFEPEALIELVNHQKKKAKILQAEGKELKKCPEHHVCVILDDLAYDKAMMKLEAIREIFFNGRHYGITLFITFQFMMELRPDMRANVDYVFVCKENKKDNLERLHKYFFGMFDKIADFKKTLQACTNDYGCLVLQNNSLSDRIEDQVFWYKARLDRKFRIAPNKWPMWDEKLKQRNMENLIDDDEKTFVRKQNSTLVVRKKGLKRNDDYDSD
jgi:hypothetical protein